MEEVVANGYIEEIDVTRYKSDRLYREAILEAIWIGPKEGQLNPFQEMRALEIAEMHGWTTNSNIASSVFGTDFESNYRELYNERQKLAEIDKTKEEVVANGYIEEIDVTRYKSDRLYREAILEAIWIGPKEGQLNPFQEMRALEIAETKGWTTNSNIASTVFGTDFESNARELANERQKLAKIDKTKEEGGEI